MWEEIFKKEKEKIYYKELEEKYLKSYEETVVYPNKDNIFKAFELTSFADIKIVILGQDPYPTKNHAHGLSFSSLNEETPKSLANIKKELKSDLYIEISKSNELTGWANQGVLLLNTILTVQEGKPLSHKDYGWEIFTLNIFKEICKKNEPVVFILWGNNARSYKKYITNSNHLIIESSHPSPLSSYRGFFGSKPFSRANKFLIDNNIKPINFKI